MTLRLMLSSVVGGFFKALTEGEKPIRNPLAETERPFVEFACRFCRTKFTDPKQRFPDRQKLFPVLLRREFVSKCQGLRE